MTATVDIEEVRSYRAAPSRGNQALTAPTYQRHETGFSIAGPVADFDIDIAPSKGKSGHSDNLNLVYVAYPLGQYNV